MKLSANILNKLKTEKNIIQLVNEIKVPRKYDISEINYSLNNLIERKLIIKILSDTSVYKNYKKI